MVYTEPDIVKEIILRVGGIVQMKIKKLLVGVVASVLVVASVATTAFAANSPSTETVTPIPKPAATSSSSGSSTGTKTPAINPDVLASNLTGEVIKYDNVDIDPTHAAKLSILSVDTIKSALASMAKANALKAADVEDSEDNPYNNSITIRFKSSAFKAGMKITVLHQPDGSSTWEKITPDSVADGECVVTFTSLSPVVFATEGASDKTGETAPILPIAAAICLAGVVFFGAKYRFAK